jgi:hypothetical protein
MAISCFNAKSNFPFSESPRGKLLATIRKDFGEMAGIGALAVITEKRFDGNDPSQVRGVIAAHEGLAGTGSTARKSVQDALGSLLKKLAKQQRRAEDKADQLDQRLEAWEIRRKHQFVRLSAAGREARSQFSSSMTSEVERLSKATSDSIVSINAVQRTFEEFMRLKAPVTYWRTKAIEHRDRARVAAVIGMTFTIGLMIYASLSGVHQLISLVETVGKETGQWQSGYVVLTIAASMLTVAFWIGRLISRTYVSHSHLAIDAEERAVMVETYLSLTKDNLVSDAERILVLTSLFRASSDGLVKDDASPDMSIAGFASKLGSGGGAK